MRRKQWCRQYTAGEEVPKGQCIACWVSIQRGALKRGVIIFDLFDTLMRVETRTNQYALLSAFIERKKEESERSEIKKEFKRVFLMGDTTTDIVDSLINKGFGLSEHTKKQLASINEGVRYTMRSLVEKEVDSVQPFDDLENCLELLSKEFDLLLLSNLATPFKAPFINAGYDKHFKACIFSCDAMKVKPDKDIFEMALSHCSGFGKEKVIMVGDKLLTDGVGAQSIGIHYFKSHGQPSFLKEFTQFMIP